METSSRRPIRWYGYADKSNLHTRKLRFTCRGVTYSVPQPFVEDLLRLRVTRGGRTSPFALRASVDGQDIVFTILGADGEKGYRAHFHFRKGRFYQRILSYSEAQTILIRTNEA